MVNVDSTIAATRSMTIDTGIADVTFFIIALMLRPAKSVTAAIRLRAGTSMLPCVIRE